MASDMPPVYEYINSLLSMPPPDQKYKQKSEVKHFQRKTNCAFAYAYDVTAFPDSSFIAVLHSDTEYLVCVEFGKEGFKALRQNDEGNCGLMIVVLDENTVKGIGDAVEFTIPEESGRPSCIAVKDSELIAISFPNEDKISLYDKQGKHNKTVTAPSLCGVFTISKDRFIYTTPKGIASISDKDEFFNTSSTPRSICCDNYGNIYVTVVKTDKASCNVECFTRCGERMGYVEIWGDPYGITLTPSRNLIVAAKKSVKIYEVPLPWGMFKCSYGQCIACTKHVKESLYPPTEKLLQIKSHISCSTKNIIYVITCKKCDFKFVDHTEQPLEKQIADHRESVTNAKKTSTDFVQHYTREDHSVDDIMITGIESLDNLGGLGYRKKYWIKTLQTIEHGLNMNKPKAKKECEPIKKEKKEEKGMSKCNQATCKNCRFVEESSFFTCSETKLEYQIESLITCTTENVIYLITCKKCNMQYVGQTQQHLKDRMSGHRSTVNTNAITTAIATHFISSEHSIEDMVVQGIESLGENPDIKEKKAHWKREVGTNVPIRDELLNAMLAEG